MNDAVIGEGAKLKNVILDKDVVVRPGAQLMGTPSNPVIVKRGATVCNPPYLPPKAHPTPTPEVQVMLWTRSLQLFLV